MQKYGDKLTAYAVGRRVNMEEWNARTGIASAEIEFGAPVMDGPSNLPDSRQVAPLAGAGVVLGITEASVVLPHTGDKYAQYDNLAYIEAGVIGVKVGSAVTKGGQAYWDTVAKHWIATDTADSIGVAGAHFDESGASGSVVPLRYRRQTPAVPTAG